MKLLKNNPISRFEAGVAASLLAVMIAANTLAISYLSSGVRDVISLSRQTEVQRENLAAAKSFAVNSAPVGATDIQKVVDVLHTSYTGLEINGTPDGKLVLASPTANDFEVLKQAVLATVPQLPGARWSVAQMCMGECSVARPGKALVARSAAAAAQAAGGTLSITLTAERLTATGTSPRPKTEDAAELEKPVPAKPAASAPASRPAQLKELD